MPLLEDDYKKAAEELGCEIATIRAVASVESSGNGFLPDGRPTVLFEAHIFHRLTKGRWDKLYLLLSTPKWNKSLYRGGAGEWDRLNAAATLDRAAALMSASWGAFQILGLNFPACGFTSVEDFAKEMSKSESRQLDLFIEFIKSRGLADELEHKDWTTFARLYNGARFRANSYDIHMAAAYEKFSSLEKAA